MTRDDRILPATRWAALVVFLILVPAVVVLWGFPGRTPDLWAWGIELAGIAYRNPTALSSETVSDYTYSQDRAAKEAILAAAKTKYGSASSPQYSFPAWDWTWTSTQPTSALTD